MVETRNIDGSPLRESLTPRQNEDINDDHNDDEMATSLPEDNEVSARWAGMSSDDSTGSTTSSAQVNESNQSNDDNTAVDEPLYHNSHRSNAESSQRSSDQESNDSDTHSTSASSSNSIWNNLTNIFNRPRNTVAAFTDGVFGNLVAKDETVHGDEEGLEHETGHSRTLDDVDDDLTPAGHPPTYEEASADATPSYWESTLLATGYGDEIIVGDMPVGSVIVFILNVLSCVGSSYFGFALGYACHTTHAGKNGSLAGLGMLSIADSRQIESQRVEPTGPQPEEVAPVDPNSFEDGPAPGYVLHPTGRPTTQQTDPATSTSWVSYLLLGAGICLILDAVYQYVCALSTYYKIKRQQMEAEGETYHSPSEALYRVWDNIYQYARPTRLLNRGFAAPGADSRPSTPPPPPGDPPSNSYHNNEQQATETV